MRSIGRTVRLAGLGGVIAAAALLALPSCNAADEAKLPPHLERVPLDADLFFFSDPAPLFEEMGASSVAIIPHRFPAANAPRFERYGIFNWHQKAGLALNNDLAATGRVGCDHGSAACGGFQKAHRQAFAVRRQHRKMAAPP